MILCGRSSVASLCLKVSKEAVKTFSLFGFFSYDHVCYTNAHTNRTRNCVSTPSLEPSRRRLSPDKDRRPQEIPSTTKKTSRGVCEAESVSLKFVRAHDLPRFSLLHRIHFRGCARHLRRLPCLRGPIASLQRKGGHYDSSIFVRRLKPRRPSGL